MAGASASRIPPGTNQRRRFRREESRDGLKTTPGLSVPFNAETHCHVGAAITHRSTGLVGGIEPWSRAAYWRTHGDVVYRFRSTSSDLMLEAPDD